MYRKSGANGYVSADAALFGNGGAGVFHVAPDDENLSALLEMFTAMSREPVIAQKYLPEIRQGDKRIILIDGVAAGAINRVPPQGEARANMHVGARAEKTTLSARERECLHWTASGKTSSEIATILELSEHTVNHYLSAACQKLGATNRAHAVARAIRAGLVD